jgi:hypothetical protein
MNGHISGRWLGLICVAIAAVCRVAGHRPVRARAAQDNAARLDLLLDKRSYWRFQGKLRSTRLTQLDSEYFQAVFEVRSHHPSRAAAALEHDLNRKIAAHNTRLSLSKFSRTIISSCDQSRLIPETGHNFGWSFLPTCDEQNGSESRAIGDFEIRVRSRFTSA